MKPGTVKNPVQPRPDFGQGMNLLASLFEKFFSGGSPLLQKAKISKHINQKKDRQSGNHAIAVRAKKKRRRKIAYQSKVEKRFPRKSHIRS